MDPFKAPGRMTSGRRTYKGNAMVGGKANSRHLLGDAADYVGTTPAALRNYYGGGVKVIPESDHLHVQGIGEGKVPYYGKRGSIGAVNGVDTTAPKGQPMIRPRKPQQQAAMQLPPQMAPMPLSGPDPLAPQADGYQAAQMPSPPPAPMAGPDPLAPLPGGDPKGGIFGSGFGIAEALTYGINGYLAGMGNPAGAQNLKMLSDADAMQFDREKFNQDLEAKRVAAMAKANEPPQWEQDAVRFANMPEDRKQMVTGYRDAMYPVLGDYVDGQGNTRQGVYSRTQGGFAKQSASPPPEAIADLKGAVAGGDTTAIAEFEQVFGPGSARNFLGN